MLTLKVLRQKCVAESEIEFFLFIYEIGQAIAIAEHEIEIEKILSRSYWHNPIIDDLENAKKEKGSAIAQLMEKFDVTDVFLWYQWWKRYLYSLNEIELVDLEKTRLNGLSLSEWYPEGHW